MGHPRTNPPPPTASSTKISRQGSARSRDPHTSVLLPEQHSISSSWVSVNLRKADEAIFWGVWGRGGVQARTYTCTCVHMRAHAAARANFPNHKSDHVTASRCAENREQDPSWKAGTPEPHSLLPPPPRDFCCFCQNSSLSPHRPSNLTPGGFADHPDKVSCLLSSI